MYLRRLLQINIATLAALGTLLLGMGQRSAGLPLLMLLAAIASVWLTDISGWFRLNRKLASLATLGAMTIGAVELLRAGSGDQFFGLARLLVYVQIVLLFQEKDQRTYRQLIMLSLLQVVVATMLSQGVWFGVLLVAYMLVGFWAMTLLCLYRQNAHLADEQNADERSAPQGRSAGHRWPWIARTPQFTSSLGGQENCEVLTQRGQVHVFGRAFLGERCLPAEKWTSPRTLQFSSLGGNSSAGVGRELFGRLTIMGLGTLALTLLLFFSLPRLGRSAWRGAGAATQHVVGFSDEVTLGELGEIIESPDEVMRVALTDAATGDPYTVRDGLYLRGSILTHYQDGQWQRPAGQSPGRRDRRPLPPSTARPPVLQQIVVEPLDRDELFCIWPFVPVESNPGLRLVGDRLLRASPLRSQRFSFTLGTTAFSDGQQSPLTPCDDRVDTQPLLQMPPLPKLSGIARLWIAQEAPAADRRGQAEALVRYFQDPARFQYSLQGQVRELDLDPIEDFLTKNPRGHCEYFATALTLMLRSRGIPARVVVGYRCDEYNDLGKFYQVRQWHAHSWVEAYLGPQDLPAELRRGDQTGRWTRGGWLRLEPTPGFGADQPATTPQLGAVRRSLLWLQSVWGNYVLEMDRDRQREAIYGPAVRAVRETIGHLREPGWWRDLFARIRNSLDFTAWAAGQWIVGILSLTVGLPIVVWAGRRLGRLLRRGWTVLTGAKRSRRAAAASEIEFYGRLERLLARRGMRRTAGQTQHEFALSAGVEIARASGRPQWASLPQQVVEAFYQVRFGRLPLDSTRAEGVEHALAELEAKDEG